MGFFKTIAISIFAAFLLMFISIAGLAGMENEYSTQVQNLENSEIISIDSRQLAARSDLAPFETMNTYISPEHKAEFNFTGVGATWDEERPQGTHIAAMIRFKLGGKWGDWLGLDQEEDSFSKKKTRCFRIDKYCGSYAV